jgi:hypothetical protein
VVKEDSKPNQDAPTKRTTRAAKPKVAASVAKPVTKPTVDPQPAKRPPQPKHEPQKRRTIQLAEPNVATSEETIQPALPSTIPSPYLELRIWCEMYQDAMQARIAASNRSERGGVHTDLYAGHISSLEKTEHEVGLELVRAYRKIVSPTIRAWQKSSPGIGEHLLARLLGIIGDPRRATPYHWEGVGKENRRLVGDEPYDRSISQLWSYCGVGDPDRKRRKGQTVEEAMACGIPLAKSVLFLLAQSCVKVNRGPYREHYDKAREVYSARLHRTPCPACGPKGKPAKEGEPWSPAHQHAAALRKVSKEILRDMWIVSQPSGSEAP